MSKSQETWKKKEREKKKLQKKKEKEEKKMERKTSGEADKSFDDMLAYIDENGNLSSTPPDPRKKVEINIEDIRIGVPKKEDLPDEETVRSGKISFFNSAKGFGFIRDDLSKESIFVHANNADSPLQENDKVNFEIEMGQRGPMAIHVKIIAS